MKNSSLRQDIVVSMRSLLPNNTGSYDLVKAQAHGSGAQDQKSNTNMSLSSSVSGFCHKLISKLKPKKVQNLSENDTFYLALFTEELLTKDTFNAEFEPNKKKVRSLSGVRPLNEYPVINICSGFKNYELNEGRNNRNSSTCLYSNVNRVSDGINRVLFGNYDDEDRVDGIPVSFWLQVLEPAFDVLKNKTDRRSNKSPLTKRRQKLRLRPGWNRWPLMGDSPLMHNPWGPFMPQQQNRLFEMFATRFGELGERHRRARHVRLTDTVIPDGNTLNRSSNQSRFRFTRANPNARRNGSNTDQTDQQQDNSVRPNNIQPPQGAAVDPLLAVVNIWNSCSGATEYHI